MLKLGPFIFTIMQQLDKNSVMACTELLMMHQPRCSDVADDKVPA
jgi:hypothetical protein